MSDTKIEWTDKTWNPVTGCTKISPGCAHCYAEGIHKRFKRNTSFLPGEAIIRCHPDRLDHPLKWRKPQRIFVNSMSDLFHEDVPDEFIGEVFIRMAMASKHTFQILTKRPERMLEWFAWAAANSEYTLTMNGPLPRWSMAHDEWPLPNVHLYVSVENQYWADRRIPLLLQTPAAVRGVSYEPALKAVDFSLWLPCWCPCHLVQPTAQDEATGYKGWDVPCSKCGKLYDQNNRGRLDHIIMGGESGPGARAMHSDWVRSTRDQCVDAGVAFFFKQWGEWFPRSQWEHNPYLVLPGDEEAIRSDDDRIIRRLQALDGIEIMYKVGKKAAGAMLDGREWREFPKEAVTA